MVSTRASASTIATHYSCAGPSQSHISRQSNSCPPSYPQNYTVQFKFVEGGQAARSALSAPPLPRPFPRPPPLPPLPPPPPPSALHALPLTPTTRLSPPLHTPSTPLLHPSSRPSARGFVLRWFRDLCGHRLRVLIHRQSSTGFSWAYISIYKYTQHIFTTVTCTSFGTWSRRDNACFDLWSLREAC